MPIYTWRDKLSGNTYDVIRRADDFEQPPTAEEFKELDGKEEWERLVAAIPFKRGASWKGSKGNWIALLAAGTALLGRPARACEARLLSPEEVSIEAKKYDGEVHEPYLNPEDKQLQAGASFNNRFDLLGCGRYSLFSDNKLHFDQTKDGIVKHGGWYYQLGASVPVSETAGVEVGREHHSQHVFEDTRPQHFPVYDAYFIRLIIYRRP